MKIDAIDVYWMRLPLAFVALEDQAAVEAHRASDHFKTLGRKMGEYMEGRPEVVRLREVDYDDADRRYPRADPDGLGAPGSS